MITSFSEFINESKDNDLNPISTLILDYMSVSCDDTCGLMCIRNIKKLIENGVDVDEFDTTDAYKNDMTPLMQASMYGLLDIVKMLIDAGADVNITNDIGYTALNFATSQRFMYSKGNSIDTIKYLIQNGADVNLYDNPGSFDTGPFEYLCWTVGQHSRHEDDDVELVKFFIQNGADVNSPSKRSQDMFYVIINGRPIKIEHKLDIMDVFINAGVELENIVKSLINAIKTKNDTTEVIKYFVNKDVDAVYPLSGINLARKYTFAFNDIRIQELIITKQPYNIAEVNKYAPIRTSLRRKYKDIVENEIMSGDLGI